MFTTGTSRTSFNSYFRLGLLIARHLLVGFRPCPLSALLQTEPYALPAQWISRPDLLRHAAIVASGGISAIGRCGARDRVPRIRPISGFICLLCLKAPA